MTMPNLNENVRAKCEKALGLPVLKVKWTDDPLTGLALLGGGVGVWINLETYTETKPATIHREVISVIPPAIANNGGEKVMTQDDAEKWIQDLAEGKPKKQAGRRKGKKQS